MHLLQAGILGLVEGITEFLPISSTGHLILTGHILGLPQTDFQKSFEIIIQLGAILAIVVLYFKKLLGNWKIFSRVAVAFIPTGILGLLLYKFIKTYLLSSTNIVLWSLFLGGVALIIFERFHKKDASQDDVSLLSYKQAFLIGLFQCFAFIPGVSRSAATIVGGMAMGISRTAIVEFSFLLAVPTMLAATGYDIIKNIHEFSASDMSSLGIGFIVAFISAFFAVRFLLRYVRTHTFTAFGIYRIALVLVFIALGMF